MLRELSELLWNQSEILMLSRFIGTFKMAAIQDKQIAFRYLHNYYIKVLRKTLPLGLIYTRVFYFQYFVLELI